MTNTVKRLLSALLVLAMLVSLSPAVYATEGDTEATEGTAEVTGTVPETSEEPTEASEEATEASEEATEATEEATEATEEATEATEEATEATEETTETDEEVTVEEELGEEAVDASAVTGPNMAAAGLTVVSITSNKVADGVSYDKVISRNSGKQQNVGYLTKVDMSKNVAIKAAYNGYYAAGSTAITRMQNASSLGWGFSKTTILAAEYASIADPAGTVVMATNGDYFNMGTGEPNGSLIMEGNAIKIGSEPYFAILKDGTAVIRDAGADASDVVEAIAGPFYLIKNGENVAPVDNSPMPRNSVGVCADGSVVFYLNDGRQAPTSVGMSLNEVASVLLDAGCVTAIYLDGGGSATVAARPEGSSNLRVINSPSDGAEREVSSGLLIVSTAEATGEFDHAAITPNDELYTPGSQVQFTATGVDASGSPADIPEDVQWVLAESCADMGTIDATGLFTAAADKTGMVTVELRQGGKAVGSAFVEIVKPDAVYFDSDEISLGFEDTTDFGLVVRYLDRDVNYKVGDILWTMSDEKLGTFDGNLFTTADGESLNGTITATSAFDETVTSSIHVIVGMLPTVVWDFEDRVDEGGNTIPAEEYYGSILTHSNYGRGGKESFEIVSIDDGEPVRFGAKSLKLNYDFTQCGAVTEGACVGTTQEMAIPGTPTGIGVWVYAPEGVGITWEGDGTQAGFWLRGYVRTADNSNLPFDFVLEPKAVPAGSGIQPGISWTGWKYLEADLTKYNGPFAINPGMTFRLMYVAGTKMGTKTANSIYFDNLQFVYGTNVDDTDAPKVDSIKIGNTELTNGAELTSGTIPTLRATFSDVQNKYTTGVDGSTVRMYIDGVNVVDNDRYQFALNANDGYAELYNLKLTDGSHSLTVTLRDGAGNDAELTRYFTVKNGMEAPTTVTLAPVESIASLGGVVTLEVKASDETVKTAAATVRLSNMFPDVTVEFTENYTGTYKYSKSSSTVTLSAQRKAEAEAPQADEDVVIAKIIAKVPATLTENEFFLYEVKSCSFTTASDFYATYSAPEAKLPVGAGIAVSCDPILIGGDLAKVKVTDVDGKAVANVGIYLASDNTLLGTTDENGIWETDYFSDTPKSVTVYAKAEDGRLSFQYNVISYAPAGSEVKIDTQLMFNGTADSTTQKNISWISDPLTIGKQCIQYRVKTGDDSKSWSMKYADTQLHTFSKGGDYQAANFNSVTLKNLTPGKTYEYRIGNGINWSDIAEFTTDTGAGSGVSFFVMSDIQADDRTNVNNMITQIKKGGYRFGIQTGDAIDDMQSYPQVSEAAQLLGIEQLGDIDVVHVLGNHEYAGDANASITSDLYNLPASEPGSHYSMTYGDVYVAVINYTGTNAELKEALEWLVADAQASSATWKILTMHQPPYYTNATGGNAPINEFVPAAAQEAGINVVFSGHDHVLARTNRLTDGEIDDESGILYYIGGSSGEKSYGITSQTIFDHKKVFAVLDDNFTATYIGVTADAHKMVLKVYDVTGADTQKEMDTYTLYTEVGACIAADHEGGLEAPVCKDGKFTCTKCGETVDPAELVYTGWATDFATGRKMYFLAGEAQTGEFLLETETYYFDENGVALDGKLTIEEVEVEFDDGLLVGGFSGFIKKTDDNTYYYVNGKMVTGWLEIEEHWYHFNTDTGVMTTGTHVKPDAEAASKNAYYDFADDGKLLRAYFNPAGYYYWAGLPLADAWVKNGADPDPDAWYRTNGNGHFVKDPDAPASASVLIPVDGVTYTFDNSNGKLLKGSFVSRYSLLYYYWAGEPVNDGWFTLEGNTYYAYSDGHLAKGSHVIDGKEYTFNAKGVLITEGTLLFAGMTEDHRSVRIKLMNAPDDLVAARFGIWEMSNQSNTLQWVKAEKDEDGVWTALVPTCGFNTTAGGNFVVHAYGTTAESDKFLTDTTVEVTVIAPHVYTDNHDATCNDCGFVREVELEKIETTPMYRLYNPNSGEHFFTGSEEERDDLVEAGWNYEGVAWNAPIKVGDPVYRVFNPNSGDHHYTMSMEEVYMLTDLGWKYEGVAWNCAPSKDPRSVPQYRLYNPNADLGCHHYTSSKTERDKLVKDGWKYEGIGWYGMA